MAAPGSFTAGQVLTAAEMNALPGGQLAYAETSSDFTLTTATQDIVNTSVTLTASRVLLITGYIPQYDNPSTTLNIVLRLRDDVAGSGSQYANSVVGISLLALSSVGFIAHKATFAAGTYNFYLAADTSTGTARANGAASTRNHFVLVEDLGEP